MIRRIAAGLVPALCVLLLATTSFAAKETRNQLYTFFETGDVPGNGHTDLDLDLDGNSDIRFRFGSFQDGHTVSVLGTTGGIGIDIGSNALRFDAGQTWNPATAVLASFVGEAELGAPSDWPGQGGFLPFEFEITQGQSTTLHAGYLQMSVDAATSADPYAIRITGVAWESTPNTPILITTIPEPRTAMLLGLGLAALTRAARQPRR